MDNILPVFAPVPAPSKPVPTEITIDFADDDPEVVAAGRYLVMKDLRWKMMDIAEAFGYKSRTSLYGLVDQWEKSGALEKARKKYMLPKEEEIQAAFSVLLDQVPAMVARLSRIVLTGKEHNAVEAWKVLEPYIERERNRRERTGSAEQAYADRPAEESPNVVTLPTFIQRTSRR